MDRSIGSTWNDGRKGKTTLPIFLDGASCPLLSGNAFLQSHSFLLVPIRMQYTTSITIAIALYCRIGCNCRSPHVPTAMKLGL